MYRTLLFEQVIIDRSITGGKWIHVFRTEKKKFYYTDFPLYCQKKKQKKKRHEHHTGR